MKTLPFKKSLNKIIFLLLVLFFNQEGFSQKNVVKITPLKIAFGKVNLSYERKLNETWSLLIDAQHWFIKDREVNSGGLFELNFSIWSDKAPPVLESNKGTRFNLGVRGYSSLKEMKKMKRNFYFGGGGFVGQHQISMERKSYFVPEQDSWFGGSSPAETHPRLNGEVSLISGGVYFDFGVQLKFKNNVSMELGLISGRAWINQEESNLTLYNHTPYNLDIEKETLESNYSQGILGAFFQPMFNVGYSF